MSKALLTIILLTFLIACGGGSSSNQIDKPTEEIIATYMFSNKPLKKLKFTFAGKVELLPTMIVTINFSNNIKREDIDNLLFNIHMSADSSPDYSGQEFAYFFEKSKAYYRYTYGDVEGYCCTDSTDTYYEINNTEGYLQLKLFHYGIHTSTTWAALKEGIFFNINAESKFVEKYDENSIISNDFIPEEGIFTTGGYYFDDAQDDYIGNENSADVSSINIELNFEYFKEYSE